MKALWHCVRIQGDNTEAFDVMTGLRQCCILSSTLFYITLDYIMRRSMDGKEGIQVGEKSLKDTEYADDAALLTETDGSSSIKYLVNESEKFGLILNFPMTKIIAVPRKFEPLQQAVVNNNNIEVVEYAVYLGSQLCSEGGSEADMKRQELLQE